MNIEAEIIEYLNRVLTVPVSADVPKNRPKQFVTIERTSGNLSDVALDHASIAVQSWAKTRTEASELSEKVDTAMVEMNHPNITRIVRDSIYNWPDTDYSMARYQGVYDVIFYKEY